MTTFSSDPSAKAADAPAARYGGVVLRRSGRRPFHVEAALIAEAAVAADGCAFRLALYRPFRGEGIVAAFRAAHGESGVAQEDAALVRTPDALADFLRRFEPGRILPTPACLFVPDPSDAAAEAWRAHADACHAASAVFAALAERLFGAEARPWSAEALNASIESAEALNTGGESAEALDARGDAA